MIYQNPANRLWRVGDSSVSAEVRRLFDALAAGYDHPSLRFYPFSADRAVHGLRIRPGDKVLDVGAGSGAAAVAAAQYCTPGGRVTAVDHSEVMLERLYEQSLARGLRHIDIHPMDAAALEFRRDYFDVLVGAHVLNYLPDMLQALKEWLRVLKPGGRLVFTVFAADAFSPLAQRFMALAERREIELKAWFEPLNWRRLGEGSLCRELADAAGLTDVQVRREPSGLHLNDASQWWDVIWNSGFRGQLVDLPFAQQGRFRADHLAEIGDLQDKDGVWMKLDELVVSGCKPKGLPL